MVVAELDDHTQRPTSLAGRGPGCDLAVAKIGVLDDPPHVLLHPFLNALTLKEDRRRGLISEGP